MVAWNMKIWLVLPVVVNFVLSQLAWPLCFTYSNN
jgi:hypothetical protein